MTRFGRCVKVSHRDDPDDHFLSSCLLVMVLVFNINAIAKHLSYSTEPKSGGKKKREREKKKRKKIDRQDNSK